MAGILIAVLSIILLAFASGAGYKSQAKHTRTAKPSEKQEIASQARSSTVQSIPTPALLPGLIIFAATVFRKKASKADHSQKESGD